MASTTAPLKRPGEWIDEIVSSIGKHMALETSDGIERKGKITGLTMRPLRFNGFTVRMPTEIEINGDPSDRVPLDRLIRLVIY